VVTAPPYACRVPSAGPPRPAPVVETECRPDLAMPAGVGLFRMGLLRNRSQAQKSRRHEPAGAPSPSPRPDAPRATDGQMTCRRRANIFRSGRAPPSPPMKSIIMWRAIFMCQSAAQSNFACRPSGVVASIAHIWSTNSYARSRNGLCNFANRACSIASGIAATAADSSALFSLHSP
jgi:hypothetical protein